ncbi:hypothetical protein M2163_000217 [Streptomyces sp. SAI-135]|nr:hypothetical protein [Streptomyces sp. SAI-090]MDH6574161.1 hypothetical protein [Streptomyces sp. SAI-117]MDH6581102.1 hypothetical protein [Streptomyces sp. SAI-133]MDH6613109.1 hypothetical protein [Streptomyces sp. SAI-135]
MIIWLSHHNDHEARACSAIHPNRPQPDQPHDPELASTLRAPAALPAEIGVGHGLRNQLVQFIVHRSALSGGQDQVGVHGRDSGHDVPHPARVRGPLRAEPEEGAAGDDEPSRRDGALPRLCLDLRLPLRFGLLHQCLLEAPLRLPGGARAVALHSAAGNAQPFGYRRCGALGAREEEFHLGSRGFRRGTGEQGAFGPGEAVEELAPERGRRRVGVLIIHTRQPQAGPLWTAAAGRREGWAGSAHHHGRGRLCG